MNTSLRWENQIWTNVYIENVDLYSGTINEGRACVYNTGKMNGIRMGTTSGDSWKQRLCGLKDRGTLKSKICVCVFFFVCVCVFVFFCCCFFFPLFFSSFH